LTQIVFVYSSGAAVLCQGKVPGSLGLIQGIYPTSHIFII